MMKLEQQNNELKLKIKEMEGKWRAMKEEIREEVTEVIIKSMEADIVKKTIDIVLK